MDTFLTKDELVNIIYACDPDSVVSFSQTNKTIYNLSNSSHVLKELSSIHCLKETPLRVKEFLILEKLNHKPIKVCIYNIIKHNLTDKFYGLIENTMGRSCSWGLFLRFALEHGSDSSVSNLIKLICGTTYFCHDDIWCNSIDYLACRENFLELSLRLLSFLKDVDTFYNGKHAIFLYLIKVMYFEDVIVKLENFVNNDTTKKFLHFSDHVNYVAVAACVENNKHALLWALNHGANNYTELANRIVKHYNWKLIYLLVEYSKYKADKNFIEYIIQLIQSTSSKRGVYYYGREKEVRLLEYLIKLNNDMSLSE
jgi:hypothetical protein